METEVIQSGNLHGQCPYGGGHGTALQMNIEPEPPQAGDAQGKIQFASVFGILFKGLFLIIIEYSINQIFGRLRCEALILRHGNYFSVNTECRMKPGHEVKIRTFHFHKFFKKVDHYHFATLIQIAINR